jgi:hypothetical protein
MHAILANDDWPTWLGDNCASPDEAKACLKLSWQVRVLSSAPVPSYTRWPRNRA